MRVHSVTLPSALLRQLVNSEVLIVPDQSFNVMTDMKAFAKLGRYEGVLNTTVGDEQTGDDACTHWQGRSAPFTACVLCHHDGGKDGFCGNSLYHDCTSIIVSNHSLLLTREKLVADTIRVYMITIEYCLLLQLRSL